MDVVVLKKRLSTFKTEKGTLKNVSNEVLFEVLNTWEQWTGTAKDFYTSIGVTDKRMATIIGRAKKLKREGHFPEEEFQEIKLETADCSPVAASDCGIELAWDNGKVIRFRDVNLLVDFLKKAA
jgi:hypothetical protein